MAILLPRMSRDVIYLHPEAPAKPVAGQACNGCGACCTWQPCPVGIVLSRRRHGACVMLRFEALQARYFCGVMQAPATLRWRPLSWAGALLRRLAGRWIAAGKGCDFDAEAQVMERVG